jgi:N-acetylglucosamine malate deacetylase 2
MKRSLLLIFAHPDDETFLAGGIACKYTAQGARVSLVTATLGEAGKAGDPPVCPPSELAAVRERELRAAAGLLGIAELYLLGYRDRELSAAPPDEIRERLVAVIRWEQPDVVVTFDPNGANLHPDHVAISRFTADAVAAAADPRWFPSTGAPHRVRRVAWVPGRRPWELLRRPDLAAQPGIDFVVDVSAYRQTKTAALRAHATQHRSAERNFFVHPDGDKLLDAELFRQGAGPDLPRRPLRDLFDLLGR